MNWIWTVAVLLVLTMPTPGAAQQKVEVKTPASVKTPMPTTVAVWTPDPSVPAAAAAFSGIWVGQYTVPGIREVALAVQQISPANSKGVHKVEVLYSWGPYGPGAYQWQKEGQREFDGEISNGELTVDSGRLNMRWKMQTDGTLLGTWAVPSAGLNFEGTFKKVTE